MKKVKKKKKKNLFIGMNEGLKAEFQWLTVLCGIECSFWAAITDECASMKVLLSPKNCMRFYTTW